MTGDEFQFGGEVAWRPTAEQIGRSRLTAFIDRHGLRDYAELMQRSTSDLEWFWRAVLEDLDIQFYHPYTAAVDLSRGPAWPRWCVGGQMNIVHNCLDKWIGTPTEQIAALIWEGEDGRSRTVSYGELWREVNRCAAGLRRLGVTPGDRVALFMPMCPELMTAFFATIKIGAIVLPLFSGYGPDAVAARLVDAGATVLVTADGFSRRGRPVAMKSVADQAVAAAAGIRHVIVVERLESTDVVSAVSRPATDVVSGVSGPATDVVAGVSGPATDVVAGFTGPATDVVAGFSRPASEHRWRDLLSGPAGDDATERTGADDPLMLIYTSGTTGRPKGAVHTHCGFPVKTAQDMVHAFDVNAGDTMYWVSDMGWMMGPWEAFGMTLLGGTMVLYDGALDYPAPDRLWAIVERHRVNILGVSPTLIRSLMHHGAEPVTRHDVSSLRILGSTGEPWNPEPWRWFFEVVGGGRLPIINYSGGTEVSGGLVAGNVITPLKPAAFAGPPPGIAADVVDDHGQSIRNQVGELVVRAPWIGMTRGFWNDPERYEQTYWSRFPGVWVHGDWAAIDEDGLWYILGRSDDTIKIAGKRLGPAEVESVLVEHPAVVEAAAIGIPDPMKGQSLVCFCVLRPGHDAGPAIAEELKALVAERLGKPLKPQAVEFVRDLPKTRNAKVMRRVIRAAYLGESPGDLSSLENPAAVEEIGRASKAPRR